MRLRLMLAMAGVLLACSARAVQFAAAEPIWTTAERGEVNSSVAFTTHFEWDGKSPLKLRLAGCSIFKVFVNGEFAAYGPARGPHGWFRMDEWDLSRVARKGDNRLSIVGVAYNTTTYYIVEHEPFLQAEVLSGGKVVRATGDGKWDASFTERVRKAQRYSLQRAQSEVYEVPQYGSWEWWKRDGFVGKSLVITNAPSVKLLERGAPYPKFEIDGSYRPTEILSVKLRTGDLGEAPHLWDEKSSFLGRTYPGAELKYHHPDDHVNKNYIPNWSMWFILELANYFDRTGDRETVDLLRPRVEGLLKFYAQYLNADGALENLSAWVFVEWSHANDTKLVKDGVNWPSNMTYSDVLSKAARLYNRPELAEQSKKLKALIRERSYGGVWFRDNAKHPDVTETCQYYAFFHGIATPKTHPELWKKLTDEFGPERRAKGLYKEVWPSNAFIGNLMRLVVLKREGCDAQVSREIRGYYLKMAETTGTLWEHDRPEASCNHAFASYLAILLQSDSDLYFRIND